MRKILLTIIGLALASPAWSSQTAVTEISGTQPSVGALKTQVNTKLGTVESNRQDHETRVAAMESGKETKAVVQASAPADTTVDWYDTDQESGVLILKRHNGTTWLRASSHGVQYLSSCASIAAGMCVDTDDGKLYYHNGTAVVEVGTGTGGTGDIEGVTAGTGLSGGGTTGTVTVAIDPTYTQRRISSSCSAGASIRAIAEDGTVTCETDDTGSGSVPSGTVNGQVLLWSTDQWAASTPPWVTTASLGTGVVTWLATPSGSNLASALTSALPASKGGTGLTSLGTGVATALSAAVDGTGGLASKASLDAIPSIVFGTGIAVSEDTPSSGTDTVSIDADTAPTDGSAKPITSNAVFDALGGKQNADADLTTAAGATGAGNSKYFGTNSSGTAGFYDLPTGGSGSFTFDTFPAYEDSAHSSGIAVNGTTLAVYSSTAGKWLTVGLTDSLNATPVDTTPDAFSFTDVTNATLSTEYTALAQINGIAAGITCSGSGGTVASCTGSTAGTCGSFGATSGSITNGQYVGAKVTSSGSASTAASNVVTCSGVSDTFTVTTGSLVADEIIGTSTQGTTQSSLNNDGYAYFFPIVGSLTSNGTLSKYTITLRAQSGSRTVELALYTLSGTTMTMVSGSGTGAISYTAAIDKTDVDFVPLGSAAINSSTQYYVGARFTGYASPYTSTGSTTVYRKPDSSSLDASYASIETISTTEIAGKLQITATH